MTVRSARLAGEPGETLVEARHPAFDRGLALLPGVHRMGRTGDVQRHVGVGLAVAVAMGTVGVDGRADEKIHVCGGVVEQHGAVVGVDACFHGNILELV